MVVFIIMIMFLINYRSVQKIALLYFYVNVDNISTTIMKGCTVNLHEILNLKI